MQSHVAQSQRSWRAFASPGRVQSSTAAQRRPAPVVAAAHCLDRQTAAEPNAPVSRRDLALWVSALIAGAGAIPEAATAGLLPGAAFSGSRQYPDAIRFPRSRLNQRFAVLLMRAVYNAVDALDFVPMSDFQANFWKLRQNEYERYLQQYSPLRVQQGDLQDPLYFDFISFAQMATVDREIPRGRQVFEEYCETCPDKKHVVMRGTAVKDNAQLPSAILQTAGDAIFEGLRDGFRDEAFGGPSARTAGAHIDDLASDVQRILSIFVDKGYAIKASLSDVRATCSQGSCEYHGARGSTGNFDVRLEGPATLWGLGALTNQKSKLNTAFSAMAIDGYLRASNIRGSYILTRTPSAVTQQWTLA